MVDSAYTPIESGVIWEMISLGCFFLSLASRYLPDWLVPEPQTPMERFFIPIVVVASISGVGVFFGWVGLYRSRRPGVARVAVFLNAVVVSLTVLLVLVLYLFRSR